MMRPQSNDQNMEYQGFEQGPIRPPSEAHSLLLRVTRNCPWNHCTFCPVYKGAPFSIRPVSHVIKDVDAVHEALQSLTPGGHQGAGPGLWRGDRGAWMAARDWLRHGKHQVFLQDANSLVVPPENLLTSLTTSRPGSRKWPG